MPSTKLSAKKVDVLLGQPPTDAPQIDHRDKEVEGLVLRVFASGENASWLIRVRVAEAGRRSLKWVHLGYCHATGLADARDKARRVKAIAKEGRDPRPEFSTKLQRKKSEKASELTFGAQVVEFLAKEASKLRPATAREYRWALQGLERDQDSKGERTFHGWKSRNLGDISRQDVKALLDKYAETTPILANRLLAYLRRFFNWCYEKDLIAVVPTDRIRPPAKNQSRKRVLSKAEVAEVWAALDDVPGLFGTIFRTLLLTGQRKEEVGGMGWKELEDLEGEAPTWSIPGERTKNHLDHFVPLHAAVASFLRSVPRVKGSGLVFTTTGKTSVSGFSNAKERLDAAIATRRQKRGVTETMEPWTLHDLRRTASTRMHEDLGILPHIVEAVLNHVSGARAKVAGVYNRAEYREEKRKALTKWVEFVLGLPAPDRS